MPGMNNHPFDLTNSLVVTLFHHSLFVTSVLWLSIVAFLLLLSMIVSRRIFGFNVASDGIGESRARTYLRWSFGTLWLIDGILQFQVSMPLGLANNVVKPMSVGTPSWLHALMIHGIATWNAHPIALAAGVAWLQIGIGMALLVSNGRTGRWVAGFSAMWASLIWIVGNGAGGLFIRGATILFGWPGASLFYVVAGLWLCLEPQVFAEKFSRYTLRFFSVMLVVAAIFQVLPGAQFWHGGTTNALTTMTSAMVAIPQPHPLAWLVRHVGSLAALMGGGFNIVIVLWLLICAVGLWISVSTKWRWPVRTFVVGCVVFWLVTQDAAIFGGLATDLNSFIPMAALVWCAAPRMQTLARRETFFAPELTNSAGAVVATFGVAMLLSSVVSMSIASIAGAENTFFLAQNGPASQTNTVAPSFTLTDQFNQPYTLGEHPGRVTLMTFLDPVCWTDCPLMANQMAQLRRELSSNAKIDLVAVAADPYHETLANVRHFIAVHGLTHVKNFYFVTGSLAQTSAVWAAYGIGVTMKPTDKMSIHSDLMFIVAPKNHLKWIVPDDPLAATSLTTSSVAELKSLLALEGVR